MEIKIYNKDCINGMKDLPDNYVDLVVTDPPYEFIIKNPNGGGFMKKENKKHIQELNKSFGMEYNPDIFLNECKRIMKKFNMYIFTNKNLLHTYIKFAIDNNYKYDILIWLKSNPVPTFNGHYLPDKEYIVFIKESGATFNSKLGYKNYFTYFNKPIGKREFEHPTVKDLNFIKRCIKISSNENDIVLDGYLGSGTTAVACRDLKRNCIGYEINNDYINIINERLKQKPIE